SRLRDVNAQAGAHEHHRRETFCADDLGHRLRGDDPAYAAARNRALTQYVRTHCATVAATTTFARWPGGGVATQRPGMAFQPGSNPGRASTLSSIVRTSRVQGPHERRREQSLPCRDQRLVAYVLAAVEELRRSRRDAGRHEGMRCNSVKMICAPPSQPERW